MPKASLTIDGTEVISKENGVVSLKNTNADTSLSFSANHAGIKTALNASGDAPIYACRAWVNFNGTGTVAIRASGNVSSITDHAVGIYTVNFAVGMPDTNYAFALSIGRTGAQGGSFVAQTNVETPQIGQIRVHRQQENWTSFDEEFCIVTIFR